jgi:hypothetical protein
MHSRKLISRAVLLAIVLGSSLSFGGITFTAGHYYSSYDDFSSFTPTITEYASDGRILGTLALALDSSEQVRGLAFGKDRLLYVATASYNGGFSVSAIDSSGAIHQTYLGSTYIFGNISFGKIALDSRHLYICGQDELVRFDLGDPSSGRSIYTNNQVFDVKILPNGNLLVASAYEVDEIKNDSTFVREIVPVGSDGILFVDVRGIEYDPRRDTLFVAMLGYSGFPYTLMRLDGSSGNFEDGAQFNFGDDLFLTDGQSRDWQQDGNTTVLQPGARSNRYAGRTRTNICHRIYYSTPAGSASGF